MEQIRSFIAIELPEEVKASLIQLQDELKLAGYTFVKWVDPKSIHLTLKFLGNISESKIAEVTRAIKEASEGIPPFQLEIGELGAFPNVRQPRVAWVGVGGEVDKLISLQQRIDTAFIPLGFTPESRPFTPHLTLARLREGASPRDRQDFGELVRKTPFETKHKIRVAAVNLMRSQLLPTGAVYTCLAVVGLGTLDTTI